MIMAGARSTVLATVSDTHSDFMITNSVAVFCRQWLNKSFHPCVTLSEGVTCARESTMLLYVLLLE